MQFNAERLYILDAQGKLAAVPELVYSDAPWMPNQDAHFVHPKLSNEVSLLLLAHRLLWHTPRQPFDFD